MAKKASKAEPNRIRAPLPQSSKTVKSAGRVLEILEYFDDVQKSATVMEIAEALGYPQSSTSALLRSLVNCGYLNCDRFKRTYVTSNRVALLGSWVNSDFFAEGAIMSLMNELNDQTGDTVMLATRNGFYVQYIHVVQATSAARLHMTLGTTRSIVASGAGFAMLSTITDDEIRRLVMRVNADATDDTPQIKFSELMTEVNRVRDRGYAFTVDLVTRGGGMIAAPIPAVSSRPQMVVGIGGISQVLCDREAEIGSLLVNAIESRFGKPKWPKAVADPNITDPMVRALIENRLLRA